MKVPIGDASTDATVYRAAPSGGRGLVLAHGAGAGRKHPFMVAIAAGLAARGVDVLTFDFLYMHAGRRVPDGNDLLTACWRAAIARAREVLAPRWLWIGGRSMGGRIASQVAAAGEPGVDGLVLLAYPLHPPDRPERLRAAHLGRIRVPILCVQGERDPFGPPDELGPHFPRATKLVPVAGGHSFAIDDALLDGIAGFIRER
ncbi:MAG TPA: alpha/beta fold hydrolase [Haliangiales bacterium]|nr:alpha/beta fold hydrolase [Haliangiales bacterium]